MNKKKVISMMLALVMIFSVSAPAFAESFVDNDLKEYNNAVEKVKANNELPDDIKNYLLTELEKRHEQINSAVYNPTTEMGSGNDLFSQDLESMSTSDDYRYFGTDEYDVTIYQKRADKIFFYGRSLLGTSIKGNAWIYAFKGVLYVYAFGLTAKYDDFKTGTIERIDKYIKWGYEPYDYSLKFIYSFWFDGKILDAFNGRYYQESIWKSDFID